MVQINQNPCRVAGGTGRRVGFLIILFFVFFVVVFFLGRTVATYHKKSKWESFFFLGVDRGPLTKRAPQVQSPHIIIILLLLLLFWS
jgi:hypothetical protein